MSSELKTNPAVSHPKWSAYEQILPQAFNGSHVDYERILATVSIMNTQKKAESHLKKRSERI